MKSENSEIASTACAPDDAGSFEKEAALVLLGSCSASYAGLDLKDCFSLDSCRMETLCDLAESELLSDCRTYFCCFGLKDLPGRSTYLNIQELFLTELQGFHRILFLAASKEALAKCELLMRKKKRPLNEPRCWFLAADGPVLGYLAALGSGAAGLSLTEELTICNIDIGASATRFAVFSKGRLIDQCCLELGSVFLRFGVGGTLLEISEWGETFLDAVAKLRQFQVNQIPCPELINLVASLYSEIVAHCANSADPPQVARRVLQNEPLRHDYQIDRYFLSGGVSALIAGTPSCGSERTGRRVSSKQLGGDDALADMGEAIAAQIQSALSQRSLKVEVAKAAALATMRGALYLSPLLTLSDYSSFADYQFDFAQLQIRREDGICMVQLQEPLNVNF